ncbi:MAG: hypothetical protein V4620_13175 [Bacteroidota bacterium]
MQYKPKHILFLASCLLVVFSACTRKKLVITNVPTNTPKGSQIFVAGNFNNWNPGDANYILKYNAADKTYWVDLPMGFGKIEYKFTRGDWTTTETDSCGGEFGNRTLLTADSSDQIENNIVSWHDLEPVNCSRMVLEIDSLPVNTPKNTTIFFMGNINNWGLANESFKFTKAKNNKYYLTLFKLANKVEFKINRGFNETVEANEFGREVNIRQIDFGKKDTVRINIKAWLDLPLQTQTKHTFIIESVPQNTPKNADVFLVGDFNNWNPYDKNLTFSKLPGGKLVLTMNFNDRRTHEFKVTRGGWDFQEADANFQELSNRTVNLLKRDTTYLRVVNWFDKAPNYKNIIRRRANFLDITLPGVSEKPVPPPLPSTINFSQRMEVSDGLRKIIFIIHKVPEYTEPTDRIYLAGDFNNWNDKDDRFVFKKLSNGKYIYVLKLKDNEAHEFKITRGGWHSEEANARLEKLSNRKFECCQDNDTVDLRIVNWLDYSLKRRVVFIIEQLPPGTTDAVYLTGDFNNWNEKDERFKFSFLGYDKRILHINSFNKNYNTFKITRGNWDTEFANKRGNALPDMSFRTYIKNDTIRFTVPNWKDER